MEKWWEMSRRDKERRLEGVRIEGGKDTVHNSIIGEVRRHEF